MSDPHYEGSPTVNPETSNKVNGRPIQGWVIQTLAGIRKSVELFKPKTVPSGQVAKPLVCGDEVLPAPALPPVAAPARALPPVAAPGAYSEPPGVAELRQACLRNKAMGYASITCDYALKCLGDGQTQTKPEA